MKYYHVDVFSSKPLSGNGLTVILPTKPLSDQALLDITREFRQFESIFLYPLNDEGYSARIFTVDEELDFAGHPILGAGAVVHKLHYGHKKEADIYLLPGDRRIHIHSRNAGQFFQVTMNQGEARFLGTVSKSDYGRIAEALNLQKKDIAPDYPVEVVSTGLPYLLVPVSKNLDKCCITNRGFEEFLSEFGAKFVYVFDPGTLTCRTWDNFGNTEDVATGSAAGPLCAYLVKNGKNKLNEVITLHQGEYVGRPSIIKGWTEKKGDLSETYITGEVSFFASGTIDSEGG
ncbi:PhzF family phenazine biosynthesis protein [Deltaproteobacteria bacterium Smac51]|nr:PhzF family phenazine biosynthesis protein [Deltaproteobacteria bacterium Smac51]